MAMRRKKQPTADMLRQQLALAADEIIRLRGQVQTLKDNGGMILFAGPTMTWLEPVPWWRRALRWFA